MAQDVIKLDYEKAEEMIRAFKDGTEHLQDTAQDMQSIASTLEDGALLGRGGSTFVESIRTKLCPALARLTQKFQELEGDVQKAVQAMKDADEAAKQATGNV